MSRRNETQSKKGSTTDRKTRVVETEIEKIERELVERQNMLSNWTPKTQLGRMVKAGKFNSLDELFSSGQKILEPEIIDSLTNTYDHLIQVARTTRVTRAGRKYSYRADVIVGNKDGYIGVASAKNVDRFPAINKAKKLAKLNLIKVYRGSGSWEEQPTDDKHSVPFKVEGKSGSVRVTLLPAPKGTGLAVGKAIRPVMELAGLQNVWGQTKGRSSISLNFVKAAVDALKQTGEMKATRDVEKKMSK